MAKVSNKNIFLCSECGNDYLKWHGKCPNCKKWGTLNEINIHSDSTRYSSNRYNLDVAPLSKFSKNFQSTKTFTAIPEFDRVLGGGIFTGAMILLGGSPGIGKSTLALQVAGSLDGSILYISAEESLEQIGLRGKRLKIKENNVSIISENRWELIEKQIIELKPSYVIIDSIQTIFSEFNDGHPGTISQVRECGQKILDICKSRYISVIIIAHVTKEGIIAGPRMLEHMVDTILFLEGDSRNDYRLLRSYKNRFGATNEVGVFEMSGEGLKSVENPSKIFLSERQLNAPGSTVFPSMEGSRPILVEVQALVSNSSFSTPQRNVTGFDLNRLSMLVAVLEKRLNISVSADDIFINIVGGMNINEPAADMAIIAAIASSKKNVFINAETILLGEIGLSGELRSLNGIESRLKESNRLGFKRAIVPKKGEKSIEGMKEIVCKTVSEAFDSIF
ncbi:MAG: DNA repair protein RadA [Candidatus Marinimicrobia bacterium]|nr:DNA repair protein RadA [Candidatus Neomarinimicrobiota bacterium]|tara:strand:- start:991 stop:2337 length:1347 start_codon:yes stop_codon:yes gene_type:complete